MDKGNLIEDYRKQSLKVDYDITGKRDTTIREQMAVFLDIDGELRPDIYGKGSVINDFEEKFARLFAKERAVFFPSGTMAQQIALRIHCDNAQNYKVAYHPLCHLEIHENEGLKRLHPIESILLGHESRFITMSDLEKMGDVSSVLIELPQREIGGDLPSWEELQEMVNYLKSRNIKVHLDGARIFECMPYYKKTYEEVGDLFDSIYISFYKGLGGVTGAMLLGDSEFMEDAIVWKRRYGGDLYHLYPYIITSDKAFKDRQPLMSRFYDGAIRYSEILKDNLQSISINPEVPKTNMFHLYFYKDFELVIESAIAVMEEFSIKLFGGLSQTKHPVNGQPVVKSEISISEMYDEIPEDRIIEAVKKFNTMINNL